MSDSNGSIPHILETMHSVTEVWTFAFLNTEVSFLNSLRNILAHTSSCRCRVIRIVVMCPLSSGLPLIIFIFVVLCVFVQDRQLLNILISLLLDGEHVGKHTFSGFYLMLTTI